MRCAFTLALTCRQAININNTVSFMVSCAFWRKEPFVRDEEIPVNFFFILLHCLVFKFNLYLFPFTGRTEHPREQCICHQQMHLLPFLFCISTSSMTASA